MEERLETLEGAVISLQGTVACLERQVGEMNEAMQEHAKALVALGSLDDDAGD